MTTRPARPRDADATRARILDAARRQFGARGYRSTAVKQIADDAEVSPNLVTRYFGGKEGLFLAVAEPRVAVGDVFEGGLEGFGARLARSILARWAATEDDPLLVLLRASGERRDAAERLAGFLDAESVDRLERWLRERHASPQQARDRAEAIDALILGATLRRRVLREDLGDAAALERWLAHAIQAIAAP